MITIPMINLIKIKSYNYFLGNLEVKFSVWIKTSNISTMDWIELINKNICIQYLSLHGSISFFLLLFSAFHKVWNSGRQSKIIRIISSLLLFLLVSPGLFCLILVTGDIAPHGARSLSVTKTVDTIVSWWQLRGTVTGTGSEMNRHED